METTFARRPCYTPTRIGTTLARRACFTPTRTETRLARRPRSPAYPGNRGLCPWLPTGVPEEQMLAADCPRGNLRAPKAPHVNPPHLATTMVATLTPQQFRITLHYHHPTDFHPNLHPAPHNCFTPTYTGHPTAVSPSLAFAKKKKGQEGKGRNRT